MHRIGSLSGAGKLRSKTKEYGVVNYRIDAWRDRGGLKSANGTLNCDHSGVVGAMMEGGMLFLDLQTGGSASILITRSDGTNGYFEVSGPVPGIAA